MNRKVSIADTQLRKNVPDLGDYVFAIVSRNSRLERNLNPTFSAHFQRHMQVGAHLLARVPGFSAARDLRFGWPAHI